MPFLQKKSIQLTFSSRRSAIHKVPPRIGGHHFLLCQQTNTKDIAGQSARECCDDFLKICELIENIHWAVPKSPSRHTTSSSHIILLILCALIIVISVCHFPLCTHSSLHRDQGNLVPPGWRRISADTTAILL